MTKREKALEHVRRLRQEHQSGRLPNATFIWDEVVRSVEPELRDVVMHGLAHGITTYGFIKGTEA